MNDYVILTDSACDLNSEILKKWGVEFINLTFHFEGEDKEYSNDEMDIKTFYGRMKAGETAKTAAINPDGFSVVFEKFLSQGIDVLYIGFSSGLSTTFNSARIAAEELKEKYPQNNVICTDTLCASAGQGLLVYLAVEKKNSGASIEETARFVGEMRPSLCHWFTVDDLVYLKRGGRVSPAVAFVGGVLGIKPILHVDDAGKLVSVSKVRGRRAALTALADKYGELEVGRKIAYISHADCQEEAEFLRDILIDRYNADVKIITDIGPVIGAHSGPGTMALFFVGKNR